ncbi:MAG: hypothetical protein AAF362_17235 [Pseudomonadota bacterium]
MGDDTSLRQEFPGYEVQIAELRRTNTVFDEICTDFIAMREELESCSEKKKSRDREYLSNINESMSALRKEIRFHLHPATNQHQEEN